MNGKSVVRWIPIVVALIVGGSVAMWPPLKFVDLGGADFASRFSVLIFFSLLIERTVEIFMSVWRSQKANELEAAVQGLVASKKPADNPTLVEARKDLVRYKAETLQWTMPVALALGLLVSAMGVRSLSQFVDLPAGTAGEPPKGQLWWFNMGDILFTGALLAGGADPIHKLLDLYRKFLETSAAKAGGTR